METKYRDYFSFESIRDKEGEVVCYHVTMIGTIEEDPHEYVEEDQRRVFGKLTIHNQNKKINTLLQETNARVYYYDNTYLEGSVNIVRFAAHKHHADEVLAFEKDDRVLIEGRAYLRKANDDRLPELTVTVVGTFKLGRKRTVFEKRDLVPQE